MRVNDGCEHYKRIWMANTNYDLYIGCGMKGIIIQYHGKHNGGRVILMYSFICWFVGFKDGGLYEYLNILQDSQRFY